MSEKQEAFTENSLPNPDSCHLPYKHQVRFGFGELDKPQIAFKIVGELPTR